LGTSAQHPHPVFFDQLTGGTRSTQVRAVADVVDHAQDTVLQVTVQVLSHLAWDDQVVAVLQDQSRHTGACQIGTVVRHEGHAGEMPDDGAIVAKEAAGQLFARFRLVGRAHDQRRHLHRPAQEIFFHRLQQPVQVAAVKPPT
jgi:hypothetical protein